MINLITTSGIIGENLWNMLYGLCLIIDGFIYYFVSLAYQVFISISRASLFTEGTLRTISDRIFTILGIAMLFYMAYEILMLIVNPDKLTGENGAKKIVGKLITSIVLITLLPTIYKYMHIFQDDVLTSNVIGNVVFGSTSENSNYSIDAAGASMALSISQAFYHPYVGEQSYSYLDCLNEVEGAPPICTTYIQAYDYALEHKNPGGLFHDGDLQKALKLNIWERITGQERQMKYLPVFSTIAAVMAIKMIIAFCLDIGVRVAKLGFLQLTAPISIAQNIVEKGSIFSTKWFKAFIDCYLDIFMKLIIIYFSMFSITLVPDIIGNMFYNGGGNVLVELLSTVAVILGILQFAKDGPKLIKDLFNMELDFNIKKRLNENTYAMQGASMLGGGVASLASNMYANKDKGKGAQLKSGVGGLFGGMYQGYKNRGDIKSIDDIPGSIEKNRNKADANRVAREYRHERYRQEGYGDANGHYVPGFTPLTGLVGVSGAEALENFGKRSQEWIAGRVSREKLTAATEGQQAYNNFLDTITARDDQLKGIKAGKDSALSDLNSENKVSKAFMERFLNTGDNRSRYFRKEITKDAAGNDVINTIQEKSYEEIVAENKDIFAEYIEATAKKDIKNRTIIDLEKKYKDDSEYVETLVEDLSKTLTKSLNSLGTETSKKILSKGGFASVHDIEKAFEKIGTAEFEGLYDNIMDVRKAINIEVDKQTRDATKAAKEANK